MQWNILSHKLISNVFLAQPEVIKFLLNFILSLENVLFKLKIVDSLDVLNVTLELRIMKLVKLNWINNLWDFKTYQRHWNNQNIKAFVWNHQLNSAMETIEQCVKSVHSEQ